MSKEKSGIWKSEAARKERKERLARQKDSSKQKKSIRGYNLAGRVIGIIVAIAIIFSLAVWLLFSTGLMQRWVTAVTIGDTKLSVADVNTVFGLQSINPQRWNLGNVFTDAGQELLETELSFSGEGLDNYRDFVAKSAINEWKTAVAIYEEGQRNGFTMSEEDQKRVEGSIEQFKISIEQEATKNNISVPVLMKSTYGPGSRLEELEKYLKMSFYVEAYLTDYSQSIKITDADIQEAYEENKDPYDMVAYREIEFVAEFPKQTDEKTQESIENHTKAQAEKMKQDLEAGEDFFAAAKNYISNAETKKRLETEPESFEHKFRGMSNITNSELKDWLFDDARKEGDIAVIESTAAATVLPDSNVNPEPADQANVDKYKSFMVVEFDSRSPQNVKPYSTRHILFSADQGEVVSDAKLKGQAEVVLAEYERGEETEESFAELAKKHSKDANAEQGGLYEKISLGQFVEEYESWALDPSRKKGDVGLVKTIHGYHLIYYIGSEGEEVWKEAVGKKILDTRIEEWHKNLTKNIKYKEHSLGKNMVGKTGILRLIFG